MPAPELLQQLADIDTDLLLAINGWRSQWADYFMYAVSGRLIWAPMYAAIVYVIIRNLSWKLVLGCIITIALTIAFTDQSCASLIRPLACRLRPSNPDNPISGLVQIVNGYRGGRYGFPSCHAANTFGLAFFVVYVFRHRGLSTFTVIWALLNCYSRAYLGVHYPGDLLAGALVGFVGASLCYVLFRLAMRYKRPSRWRQAYVPMLVGMVVILLIGVYPVWKAS